MGTMSGTERDGVVGVQLAGFCRHPARSNRIALAACNASENRV